MAFARGLLAGAAIALTFAGSAAAEGDKTLSCDDGRNYVIQTRGVSTQGDLVTGYLVVGPKKRVYFRLMPMGTGYRYAGNGFWFDGVGGAAQLTLGRNHTVSCTVQG